MEELFKNLEKAKKNIDADPNLLKNLDKQSKVDEVNDSLKNATVTAKYVAPPEIKTIKIW